MMPKTIIQGFDALLGNLTPSASESEAAKSHRASIKSCLESNFDLRRFFRMGSFGNGTSISGYSDVDYFASIPTDKLKQDSAKSLEQLRAALRETFPNSGVRINCPAVKVPFGTDAKETTEVVPADFLWATGDNHLVYDIPDCSGSWMRSSPDAHNAYVRNIDGRLGNKLKSLIRFVKAWKYYLDVPISSFYLEMKIAQWGWSQNTIIYTIDLQDIFNQLNQVGLAPLWDPVGISGYIAGCSTDAKLEDALSKLATAIRRIENAREAEKSGNIEDTYYWWNKVYGGRFPEYTG
ncbi:MAG: nucleotidyltransferase [Chloroflexota bacterium]|nr:nucleotidyltransferase [Chloroflexota bacterium]